MKKYETREHLIEVPRDLDMIDQVLIGVEITEIRMMTVTDGAGEASAGNGPCSGKKYAVSAPRT